MIDKPMNDVVIRPIVNYDDEEEGKGIRWEGVEECDLPGLFCHCVQRSSKVIWRSAF